MDFHIRTVLITSLLFFASIKTSTAAVIVDFSTGLAGTGGTITETAGDVVGEDILIGAITVDGTPSMDDVYVADAILSFNTALDEISIIGDVPAFNIFGETLLTGSILDYQFETVFGIIESFEFSGSGPLSQVLIDELDASTGTDSLFYGFTIESPNGSVISTDIITTTTVVPVPAAVWLFASGLLGMLAVSRRL